MKLVLVVIGALCLGAALASEPESSVAVLSE